MATYPTNGNDTLAGGYWDQTFYGDTYYYSIQNSNTYYKQVTVSYGNDTIDGNGGNDGIAGDTYFSYNTNYEGAFNTITVNYKSDSLVGGTGDDSIYGDNYYLQNRNYDTDFSSITVNNGDDIIYGNDGNDSIYGDYYTVENNNTAGAFNTISIRYGSDTIYGGDGNDRIYGDVFDEYYYNDNNYGFRNVINRTYGNDYIDGGQGVDIMYGGAGNDTYIVDNSADVVTEYYNQGTDIVQSSINYTLSENIEKLILTDSAIIGTGNSSNNILTGNTGDNILNGGQGTDTIYGGTGNDTYIVDNSADVIIEYINEGIDTIQATAGYILSQNLENLTLTGQGNINGTGNDFNNILTGNAGDNILNGGQGADIVYGGAGNDTYILDNYADIIIEDFDQGNDTVQTSINYTLGQNFENLTLSGQDNINGTGNDLNNILTGNAGTNILSGKSGDDTYIVDNAGDIVNETLNAGIDTVESSIDYTLGYNVENLVLTGSAINGTGNYLNNKLTGNADNNMLNGGAGNDTYIYNLNSGRDTISDISGTDRIQFGENIYQDDLVFIKNGNDLTITINDGNKIYESAKSITIRDWYLGNKIESIGFIDGTSLNSTYVESNAKILILGTDKNGNLKEIATNSIISTGSGNDNIHEYFGDDIIYAGAGNDEIHDFVGNDTYIFYRGDGQDSLYDLSNNSNDIVKFGPNIAKEDIAFFMKGNTLTLAYGNNDKLTIYSQNDQTHGIEAFQLNDGSSITSNDINQIIQNMLAYAKDADISLKTVEDVQNSQALMNIVVNAWHN